MSLKDKIRSATIGQKVVFEKEYVEYNGIRVEIRQPSIGARQQLRERCYTVLDNRPGEDPIVKYDQLEFFLWVVIQNTYVPGTDELVFEETDYPVLKALPASSFMDVFYASAQKMSNVEVDLKKNT